MSYIPPTTGSIADSVGKATEAGKNLALPGSDFHWGVAVVILVVSFSLWLCRTLFLNRYKLKKQQVQNDRRITILRGAREIAVLKFAPWQRSTVDFSLRVPLPIVIYVLVSAKGILIRYCGLISSSIFLLSIVLLIAKSLFSRRSIYHRVRLLFKENPTFLRGRLAFVLARHFLYLALGFTYVSYGLNRIHPDWFILSNGGIDLFVAHFQSTLNGMTSIGPNYVECATTEAAYLAILRTVLVSTCYGLFFATAAAAFVSENRTKEREARVSKEIIDLLGENPDESDVYAIVTLVIEQVIGCSAKEIKEDSRLREDLDANTLDIAEIQSLLEQIFETGYLPESEILKLKTVDDYASTFWSHLERNKSTK